jgi:hypothetical protein
VVISGGRRRAGPRRSSLTHPASASARGVLEIINGHVHTFTQAHTPDRFLPWPVPLLVRIPLVRRILSWVARLVDRDRKSALGRYAQIIDTSYRRTQREVFEIVRGFYPESTRFVLLPMDMTKMNAGGVAVGIDAQHAEIVALRSTYPDSIVILSRPSTHGTTESSRRRSR